MLPSPDEFARRVGVMGIGEDTIVVVYDGLGLFSAPRVRWTFQVFGAKDVRILEGGFPAWKAEGRPVESGPGRKLPPKVFTPTFDATLVADAARVRAASESRSAQVLDARPAERFRGEAPEPRPGLRAGHIPGSMNLPFATIIEDGKLKDKASIERAVTEAGIDLERPVITSCGSGVSAAILRSGWKWSDIPPLRSTTARGPNGDPATTCRLPREMAQQTDCRSSRHPSRLLKDGRG